MSEFVGRTGSLRVYSYPEPRRSGGTVEQFARNFASGPKSATDVPMDPGVQIEWNFIDVGTSPSPDVPITCLSTGVVLIWGAVTLSNPSGASVDVLVQVQIDGLSLVIPGNERITVPPGGFAVAPFLTQTTSTETPVGVTANVQVLITAPDVADTVVIVGTSSSVNVQEVSASTG